MRNLHLKLVAAISISISVCSCATTDPATGARKDSLISVAYGEVTGVEQVHMQSNYAAGSVVGGGLGLAAARHRSTGTQVGAAVVGAIIGALVQKAAEGSNLADKYTVRLNDGMTVAIVSEHHDIQAGDCVSVEQGEHANIRRVSPIMCQDHQAVSTNHEIHGANVAEAEECHAVKQELLAAKTEQEAEVAYRKMRAFCEQ